MDSALETQPLYLRLADHYQGAIESGTLSPGDRMPSVRSLTRLHHVSLSTALQACRYLEDKGWLEARPRAGYFVRRPRRNVLAPASEPDSVIAPDPAQYLGIHERVSSFIVQCEQHLLRLNLAQAFGSPDAYPAEALRQAAARALRRRPEVLVSPVPTHGDPGFRAVLARRALEGGGMRLTAEDIVVTHGCTEAMNLALRAVTQPGDVVAVESPVFFGLLQTLQSLGLRALEIPTSPRTGLSVDALELALQTQANLKAVAVIPNFQNPLGSVMPDAEKQRLLALCGRYDIPLIEDDTYGALGDETPLRAIKSWDEHGQVIHCASLHKTLAPGMRLGWVAGGRWQARIRMLKYAQSRPNATLPQLALAEFMGSAAYERHLTRLRRLLHTRREQMAESIASHFPAGTRLSLPDGGMLLWIQLPPLRQPRVLFETALREGIRVAPGWIFSNSDRYDSYVRINCCQPFGDETEAAIKRLAEIARGQLA